MANTDFQGTRGLICDYGGTLDTPGVHWFYPMQEAYARAGVTVTEQVLRQAFALTERQLAQERHILPQHNFRDMLAIKATLQLQKLGIADADGTLAARVADDCYAYARRCTQAARQTLLAIDMPKVLVSNFYGNIGTVLADFGLADCFAAVIESAVVGVRKPDPAIFALGCEALGLPPEQVAVVGDSLTKDMAPAAALGCKTVWLRGRGWDDKAPGADILPTATITDIQQLAQLLPNKH